MRKALFVCGLLTLAALMMPADAGSKTLVVEVDRSGERAHDMVLLDTLVNDAIDAQRHWVDVHTTATGVEATIGDAEKDQDIIADLERNYATRKDVAVSKAAVRAFWFLSKVNESSEEAQKHFSRLENYLMGLRPPVPGLTIEDVADGAIVHTQGGNIETMLQQSLMGNLVIVQPLSPTAAHVSFRPDSSLSHTVGYYLAFVLREPLDFRVRPNGKGAVFVVDPARHAGFIDAVRKAFARDMPYTLRETPALMMHFESKTAKPKEFLPDRSVFGLLEEIDAIANPPITTRSTSDAVIVQFRKSARAVERVAAVRKLLEARKDIVVSQAPDQSLVIRLAPGVHLFAQRPPVENARVVEAVKARVAALKLQSVEVKPFANERAQVTFASEADLARFEAAITRGKRLTVRLVDQAATDGKAAPEPGSEKLPMLDGPAYRRHFIWLKRGVILTGDMVASAEAATNKDTEQAVLAIRLTDEGRALFADATRAHVGEAIALVIDGVVITAPYVREPIDGGEVQIESNYTLETAKDLAAKIAPVQGDLPLRIVTARP